MNILKKLSCTKWGADRKSLMKIYFTLIRPILDYGSVVYNSAKPDILNKPNTIQNEALRMSLGVFKSSPMLSLQAEADILPLCERRKVLSLKYYVKLANEKHHPRYYKTFHFNLKHLYKENLLPFGPRYDWTLQVLGLGLDGTISTVPHPPDPPWIDASPRTTLPYVALFKEINKTVVRQRHAIWENLDP